MNPPLKLPSCSNCGTLPGTEGFNLDRFFSCPDCGARLQVDVFPALFRGATKGSAGEAAVVAGESVCFYHETKKAAVVCDLCGRFLCGLCDCELNGRHFCPGCLDAGREKGTIAPLENSRPLYGRQALMLSLLPLFISGVAALFICARHWKKPDSLVAPRRWLMPAALVFGAAQTLLFSVWILWAVLT